MILPVVDQGVTAAVFADPFEPLAPRSTRARELTAHIEVAAGRCLEIPACHSGTRRRLVIRMGNVVGRWQRLFDRNLETRVHRVSVVREGDLAHERPDQETDDVPISNHFQLSHEARA